VLDEPTNHLDLATKEMLVETLRDFPGTMLFVSHDRTFLRGLASRCSCCRSRATAAEPACSTTRTRSGWSTPGSRPRACTGDRELDDGDLDAVDRRQRVEQALPLLAAVASDPQLPVVVPK
jgi:energy-coupling factor transporter ATP-binding protein EcfA2